MKRKPKLDLWNTIPDAIVEHSPRLAGTPAELLAVEGMADTARAGHLLGLHVSPDNEVITAYAAGTPAALIVLSEYEDIGEIWVHFGYCKPEYRRRGYYKLCVSKLKEIADQRGYVRIHTATHPENTSAIESIKARGGQVQYIGFTFPAK